MRIPLIAVAALASIAVVGARSSAGAAPLSGVTKDLAQQTQATDSLLLQRVRDRHFRGHRGGHGHGGGGAGAAAAGAIFGLAIGAMIASEAARHQQTVEWCMQRYRSYDPRTGTWVDYHGRIHRCP